MNDHHIGHKPKFTASFRAAQDLSAPIALDRAPLILCHEGAVESVLTGEGEICADKETPEERHQRIFADYKRRVAEWWQVGDKTAPWPVVDGR